MRNTIFLAICLLSIAFIVSTSLSVGFLAGLERFWLSQSDISPTFKTVELVLPLSTEPFWNELIAALRLSEVGEKITFDITRYNPAGLDSREVVERASLSQVDAMICLPPEATEISDIIDRAEGHGLPVLLLENDLPNSKRQVFLGTGSFQTGLAVGEIIRKSKIHEIRGGVLLSQSNLVQQTIRNSLFLNGLNEGLQKSNFEVHLEVLISPPGRFAGEELVWGLLRKSPAVNVLITTTSKDTSSALQTVVDANRVGKTLLVGLGESVTLKNALDQGLIQGLITRNPEEWAEVIKNTLHALFKGGEQSSYVSLPIHTTLKGGEPVGH